MDQWILWWNFSRSTLPYKLITKLANVNSILGKYPSKIDNFYSFRSSFLFLFLLSLPFATVAFTPRLRPRVYRFLGRYSSPFLPAGVFCRQRSTTDHTCTVFTSIFRHFFLVNVFQPAEFPYSSNSTAFRACLLPFIPFNQPTKNTVIYTLMYLQNNAS